MQFDKTTHSRDVQNDTAVSGFLGNKSVESFCEKCNCGRVFEGIHIKSIVIWYYFSEE